MIDLTIMFVTYVMLPFSTLINLSLLMPLPKELKTKSIAVFKYFVFWAFIISLIFFLFYLKSYESIHYDDHTETPEARLRMKSHIWKLERNYHITFFNLVNWMVGAGTCRLLAKLEEKYSKKKDN